MRRRCAPLRRWPPPTGCWRRTTRRRRPAAKPAGPTATGPDCEPGLLVAVGDAAPGQVVGADLDLNLVTGQDPDAVHAHLPRVVSQDLVAIGQLDLEHGVL